MGLLPRYPVYVISKGRAKTALTVKFLIRDEVPFHLVVEPPEAEAYAAEYGEECIRELPFADLGQGSTPARNWVWEHAKASGAVRHWILDDNIRQVKRLYKTRRIPCASGPAFAAVEDFTDRYENLAISGMAYEMFAPARTNRVPAVVTNCHVYSCLLIQNDLPYRWRGRYNEDTDLSLQVLAGGLCTALVYVFIIQKTRTMTMKGGNSDELYQADGRLQMARELERNWPHVVRTERRWGRPQHVVKNQWRMFDTPLKLKPGIDLASMVPNDYGLSLKVISPVKDSAYRKFLDDEQAIVRKAKAKQRRKARPQNAG